MIFHPDIGLLAELPRNFMEMMTELDAECIFDVSCCQCVLTGRVCINEKCTCFLPVETVVVVSYKTMYLFILLSFLLVTLCGQELTALPLYNEMTHSSAHIPIGSCKRCLNRTAKINMLSLKS